MAKSRVIKLSKSKNLLLTFGAIAFVVLGAWLLSMDIETIENRSRFNNPFMVYGMGVAAIGFFGMCSLVGLKKLVDRAPGLVIDQEGIWDNSSGVSAGLIPWTDVAGIKEYGVGSQKFIAIRLIEPDKYANAGGAMRRAINRANTKMSGTPVNISANSLSIDYEELLETITGFYRESLEKR